MSRLLTADEVAARLGVPKSWVWARARANETPCVPLGRYRRFRQDALESWIRELEETGTRSSGRVLQRASCDRPS
jgi:excisionase family DNA binding protein